MGRPPVYEKSLSNLREVESRGGRIIAITDVDNTKELKALAQHRVEKIQLKPAGSVYGADWSDPQIGREESGDLL